MWFRRILVLMVAVSFYVFAQGSFAEDKSTRKKNKVDLGQVVVSATRTEIPGFDVPQDVTVITGDEIMASPFDRVEDIVRSAPGIYNFRHYGLQTNGIVNPIIMRGVGKNRVLILVDGVPQNDNFNNAIAWVAWGYVPKDVIERIEIVRGPGSALYGSEALGGVIHIITKKPVAGTKAAVQADGGTAATCDVDGFLNHKEKDLGFIVAGGYERSDGFYMTKDPESYNIKRYREAGNIFGKIVYDIDPQTNIDLSTLYYSHDMDKGREYFYDYLKLCQNTLTYTRRGDKFGVKGILYLNFADKTAYQDSAKDDYISLDRKEKMPWINTWGGDLQVSVPYEHWMELVAGASYRAASWDYNEDYSSSARDAGANGTQYFAAPFANMEFRFFDDKLIADLGARYDWVVTTNGKNWDTAPSGGKAAYDNTYASTTEGCFSPKAGIAFHPDPKTTIRASGGKGFRAPSLFELFKVHVRSGGRYYRAANPDLKPEQIWSYDVGAERSLTENILAKATFYQSFAKDYIGDRLTDSYVKKGKTYNEYVLDNINEVGIHGVETELQWNIEEDLSFFTNYTYNISKVTKDANNESLKGKYLPNDPRHSLHMGIRYENPKVVDFSFISNYYSNIYFDNENTLGTGSYWTFDLAVSKRVFEHVTLYFNAENLFNSEYFIFRSATASDTTAPGIILSGGIRMEF